MKILSGTWSLFSSNEKRNIILYIFGIMLYKFGLEAYNGAIITLATNRYDQDAYYSGQNSRTFEKVGLLSGLNQASQCVGSILIAPLIKRWSTRTVLSASVFIFGIFTAILMIVDSCNRWLYKTKRFSTKLMNMIIDIMENMQVPMESFPFIVSLVLAFGMVELIRRVIPRDIVGG